MRHTKIDENYDDGVSSEFAIVELHAENLLASCQSPAVACVVTWLVMRVLLYSNPLRSEHQPMWTRVRERERERDSERGRER